MDWGALLGIMLLASAAATWHRSLEIREAAFAQAQRSCRDAAVQLLDDTVAFQRLRLELAGGPRLIWVYRFEYSDDRLSRRVGAVLMRGRRVEATILEADSG